MSKQILGICQAVNALNRKSESKISQSTDDFRKKFNIKIYKEDNTSSEIFTAFGVPLSDTDYTFIDEFINTQFDNVYMDVKSFRCFVAYVIRSILDERKLSSLNITLEIPIGGFPAFRENLLKRIIK